MVVITVVPKLNSLLTGRPVRFAPSPTKLDAVTIPLNLAPPSSYIVAPVPIGVSAPRTFTPATSTPALCKLEEPVLRVMVHNLLVLMHLL